MRQALRGNWASLGAVLLPKGLYARSLIIIIAPIVLLQSVLVFVFMERHWQYVTRRLSTATVQDIAMLVDGLSRAIRIRSGYQKLTDRAREHLGLVAQIIPGGVLPPRQDAAVLRLPRPDARPRRSGARSTIPSGSTRSATPTMSRSASSSTARC